MTINDGTLIVTGKHEGDKDEDVVYIHRGIAGRAFERRFQLADHIEVKDGVLENGLLHIELERVIPEEKKPRKIAIAGGQKLVESKAA